MSEASGFLRGRASVPLAKFLFEKHEARSLMPRTHGSPSPGPQEAGRALKCTGFGGPWGLVSAP